MIAKPTELRVVVRQLRIMEMTLSAVRKQLQTANPDLLEIVSPAYVRRIAKLQEEISQHFAGHPADISLILPRLDQMKEAACTM